jgi:hypothetical protein
MPDNTASYLTTPEIFLAPWEQKAQIYLRLLGSVSEVAKIPSSSPLYTAAKDILAGITAKPTTEEEKRQLLKTADWLVDVLAGLDRKPEKADGFGATSLPEEFWRTPSGKAIFMIYAITLGEKFCSLGEGAKKLKIKPHQIYAWIKALKIPVYLEAHTDRRKIRLDHAQKIDAAEKKAKKEKGKGA